MFRRTMRISNPIRTCFNVEVLRQHKLITILFVYCLVILALIYHTLNYRYYSPLITITISSEPSPTSEDVARSSENISCHLPQLTPFHESVARYYKVPDKVDCEKNNNFPILFSADFHSNLIQEQDPSNANLTNCCYKVFVRTDEKQVAFLEKCFPIGEKITPISSKHEFIAVYCTNSTGNEITVDMFNFVHLRPPVENLQVKISSKFSEIQDEGRLNVVILGIDSVSHMNFIRTMPTTYNYLVNNLSAIGMKGYTKVDDNTYPNLVPALTGKSVAEISKSCAGEDQYFDSCPFIWKKFSKQGYTTSFAEDESWMGIFNYLRKGFKEPPTDYYFRPFAHTSRVQLGHTTSANTQLCVGPRLAITSLLENIQKIPVSMRERKYFQFTWASSVTHDYLNLPSLADSSVASNLQWFNDQGYLRNTLYVMMSDHGIRYGDILNTFQGRVEERMPFLYFVFPTKFQLKYELAFTNLKLNRNRLSSPFDLHETLKDVLNVTDIKNEQIQKRQADLDRTNSNFPRGISLFLHIPAERTCENAGIPKHWCVCHSKKSIAMNETLVESAAKNTVLILNKMLEEFPKCAKLSLFEILGAQELEPDNDKTDKRKLRITTLSVRIKTTPGHAIFEGTLMKLKKDTDEWILDGDISRNNAYGNQSHCLPIPSLKRYCFCL